MRMADKAMLRKFGKAGNKYLRYELDLCNDCKYELANGINDFIQKEVNRVARLAQKCASAK